MKEIIKKIFLMHAMLFLSLIASEKSYADNIVLENITLENQTQTGFINSGQCLSIRKLISHNSVTAFSNQASGGVVTLIDCEFTNGNSLVPAIFNNGALLVRDLKTLGYLKAIENTSGNLHSENGPDVTEFVSHPVLTFSPTKEMTLDLPIKETPQVAWDNDFHNWISVVKCGAVPGDGLDDSQAIQAAIDSGGTTVYFPKGNYNLKRPVEIRGNVKRIIGCESKIEISTRDVPAFKLVDGTYDTVVFERFSHFGYTFQYTIDNASDRTLVLLNNSAFSGKFTGTVDVFIEDIVSNINSQFIFNNQNAWARHLNVESRNGLTHIVNNGGNVWILGYKTENKGTQVENRDGGNIEILGGFFYPVGPGYPNPMIVNNNSNISVTLGESYYGTTPFDTLVMETMNESTKYLLKKDAPERGSASMLPLFVGRIPMAKTLPAPSSFSAEVISSTSVNLTWTDNSTDETGFSIERKLANGNFREIANLRTGSEGYMDTGLEPSAVYYYRIRAVNNSAFSPYTDVIMVKTLPVSSRPKKTLYLAIDGQ